MNKIRLSSPATSQFWEISVLFEDASLMAIDKPSGLPTLPEPTELASESPNLMALLHFGIHEAKAWARERNLTFLTNVHRLAPEVTGALLFAKSKEAFAQGFRSRAEIPSAISPRLSLTDQSLPRGDFRLRPELKQPLTVSPSTCSLAYLFGFEAARKPEPPSVFYHAAAATSARKSNRAIL
jgi:hypothetical protein